MIHFTVPGQPQGKGRARVAMAGRPLLEGAAACNVFIDCQVPASWSAKKQRAALAGEVLPTAKPDADNVVKAVFDGINGVVWRDDVLCVDVRVRKRYSATPGVRVEVWALERPVPDTTARAPAVPPQASLLEVAA